MHACRGESGDEAREKSPHVIASHVHEQYRECGDLQPVILEVKVVMNGSWEMRGEEWTCEKENVTTDNCKLKCLIHVQCACVMRRHMRTCYHTCYMYAQGSSQSKNERGRG